MAGVIARANRRHLPTAHGMRASVVGVLGAVVLLLPVAAQAAVPYPDAMASTGDSITRAYNTGSAYSDNPAGSWSTGTASTVNSHYLRILGANPAISGKNFNDAKSGARMVDLNGQMSTVASQQVGYVTVLMGGNDICTSSLSTMTPVADFTAQFSAAMTTITASSPSTLVYVASIPSVTRLWTIFKNNGTARFVWAIFGVCQSMLKNPLSTAAADVARRAAVEQRERDFNSALSTVCATYSECRFDGNAVFNFAFGTADISTRDYFHPSLTGQKDIAAVTWSAGPWGP